MTIQLVRVGNILVGRTASDRWNLAWLTNDTPLAWSRNQTELKRLRRANPEFTFTVVRMSILLPDDVFTSAFFDDISGQLPYSQEYMDALTRDVVLRAA